MATAPSQLYLHQPRQPLPAIRRRNPLGSIPCLSCEVAPGLLIQISFTLTNHVVLR